MANFEEIIAQQGHLVYTNTGTSMMPLLRQHHDLLIIGPPPAGRLRLWDVPLYRRDNGQYILHRVLWVGRHSYTMCGDNQWHPERGITDRHVIGVLEGVNRDGRYLPVRPTPEHPHVPWRYRLYVFLWCVGFPIRAVICFIRQHRFGR